MRSISFLLYFIVTFFYCCNSSKKQKNETQNQKSDLQEIRQMMEQFSEYSIKENYEELVDFIYPEAIAKFSKEQTIDDVKSGMHNNDYDIVVNHVYTDTISDVIEKGSNKFAVAKGVNAGTGIVFKYGRSFMREYMIAACCILLNLFAQGSIE